MTWDGGWQQREELPFNEHKTLVLKDSFLEEQQKSLYNIYVSYIYIKYLLSTHI